MSEETHVDSEVVSVGDEIEETLRRIQHWRTFTPEELEAKRNELKEERKEEKRSRIAGIIKSAKLPTRQEKNKDIDVSGPWGEVFETVFKRLGKGFFFALIGIRGSGKTQLAIHLIRSAAQKYKSSRYCTATDFFLDIKATYGDSGKTEQKVLLEYSNVSLLVIDEIGQRSESEWENRLLFELLNRRYNAMLDTVVISNQSPEEFSRAMGPSLISRMAETGGIIECNWPSFRNQARE